jgi:hypothetical protein
MKRLEYKTLPKSTNKETKTTQDFLTEKIADPDPAKKDDFNTGCTGS